VKTRRVLPGGDLAPMAAQLFQNAGMETDIVTPNERLLRALLSAPDEGRIRGAAIPVASETRRKSARRQGYGPSWSTPTW
jgi:hypothetical protein